MVDGNNLLALTAAAPLEEKAFVITNYWVKSSAKNACDSAWRVLGEQRIQRKWCSAVHVVIAEANDLTECATRKYEEQNRGTCRNILNHNL